MRHLKYSALARFLAVLLAVLSAAATAAGSFAALVIYGTGLYNTPLKQVISKNFEELQKFYSVKLYLKKDDSPNCLKGTNLEYGIIHGSSREDINLSNPSSYDYYNFHTVPSQKDSLMVTFIEGKTDCWYDKEPTLLESLFNQYYYFYHPAEDLCQSPVRSIAYNRENGVFYYKTPEYTFPVYHISLNSVYAEQKKVPSEKQQASESLTGYVSFTLNPETLQYESDSGLFQPLDTAAYSKWRRFSTQSDCWFTPSDIQIFFEKNLSSIVDTQDNEVWLTQNTRNEDDSDLSIRYQLNYYASAVTSPDKTFCIVSHITEPLDLQKSDLFVQQKKVLTFLYKGRIPCLAITACSFICFLLLLAFCCYSTGCRADTAFVPVTALHKLPLLLYLAGIGSCIAGLIFAMVWYMEKLLHTNTMFLFPCLFCLCIAALLLILAAMNLSRRYKAGILWKNTLSRLALSGICRLAALGKTCFRHIWQLFCTHTSLLLKGILIFGAISSMEAVFILFTVELYGDGTFLWLFFKIAEFIVLLAALLQMKQLQDESHLLAEGKLNHKLDTSHMFWEFKKHGEYLNQIGDGMTIALEERMKSEHFRTELITNVSHDIKTPLTSIINYIDLLHKENISPETAKEYLEVLKRQSARLKKLIEDLMEASKASTGNLTVNTEKCDIDILLTQIFGEFEEKLSLNQLELITQSPDTSVLILADNRHLWRIFENLMNNICKYAQPGTRVYVNLEADETEARIIFRNISKYALTVSGEDLLERFVRGDVSRSTEGNGLGLSIAQSLAELMKGNLKIVTDGDLFKVILTFPRGIS